MRQIKLSDKKIYYFRRFRHKKFAVFFSLKKVVHISNLLVVYTLVASSVRSFSQSDTLNNEKIINLEEVEVVGEKSPLISEELSQIVAVTSLTDIEYISSQSLSDLLRYAGNIDLRQRGKNGIQSDISIRGGSFDHSLVLLNGINISDPQTGHLSLNLPVEREAVSRIEILNGASIRVNGSNAFSGAVNFVTVTSDTNFFLLATSLGEYEYYSGSLTLNVGNQNFKNLLHFNHSFSSGYSKNTDFAKQGIYYRGEVRNRESLFNFQIGYSDRAFGANSYYTPRYPDQYEENEMYLASFGIKTGKKIEVDAQTYWRRHKDRFELFREDDDWYRIEDSITITNNPGFTQFDTIFWYNRHNHHINDIYGAQLSLSKKTIIGTSILGWHLRTENIISTNIGYDRGIVVPVSGYDGVIYTLSDTRSNFNMYFEQTADFYPVYLTGGMIVNWNSYLPNRISIFPGIDSRFYLLTSTYVFGSYNYSQGLPTFTDLTYEGPSNQGNNDLKPYTQHVISIGMKYMDKRFNITTDYFLQMGRNVIDWVWFEDISKFSPVNVLNYHSQGFELSGQIHAKGIPVLSYILDDVRINYTNIDMHKNIPGNVSKFFNVRNKFSAMLQKEFFNHLIAACNVGFVEREGHYVIYDFTLNEYKTPAFRPYWLTDLRLSYRLREFIFYIEATNLFDVKYIDVGSINQPGRWITGGVSYRLSGFLK